MYAVRSTERTGQNAQNGGDLPPIIGVLSSSGKVSEKSDCISTNQTQNE